MRAWTLLLVVACTPKTAPAPVASEAPTPPDAPQREHVHTEHGVERPDPYYWMKDKADPELIPYVEAENAWTEARTAHLEAFRGALYDEMLGRIQEDDRTVPTEEDGWRYYRRTEEGKAYPIYCRKQGDDGEEQVVLDVNALAEGHEYTQLGGMAKSADHRLLAYGVDHNGRELFTWHFVDLETGELLDDHIPDISSNLTFATDGKTVLYSVLDDALRPAAIHAHVLGDTGEDRLVYREDDEKFRVYVTKTRSEEWLLIGSASSLTSEARVRPADEPDGPWRVLAERHTGHEYDVSHHGDHFYIRTNDCDDEQGVHTDCAVNFKLMKAKESAEGRSDWEEVIPHRDDVTLERVEAFADHLVLQEREGGVKQLAVRAIDSGDTHRIELPEDSHLVYIASNPSFDTSTFRYGYSSPITPWSIFDYDLEGRTSELRKEDPVLGGYDRAQYQVERVFATSHDGVQVPITVVQRKDLGEGPHPVWLTGYGSYGIPNDPSFDATRLSLLDRGMVFAIAHIRGGGDNGRTWYEDGKFLKKKNTFHDFIAAADLLVDQGITTPDQLAIQGGSAGGLLMGAVVNMRPELFRVSVAAVPFVDIVTTMLDESIPLTTNEWEEWGNPADKEYFDYMLSYSPYDNVGPKPYPAMLIESGLNDPRVQYWEPTKWTARLRDHWQTDRELLLRTNMGAGHSGSSGRYGWLEDRAFRYAFVLDQLGLVDAPAEAAPPAE